MGLAAENIDRVLFLAVDTDVYTSFFTKSLISQTIEQDRISLLIIDITTKRIIKWITQ
ncbi:hypothetical protein J2I47_13830 [Fibrella sp. HMF5335]|uniref:Uncharacterized protein n=1 Tax=Fibrella rubiginis TaxID=2817060 RepID=A0A939GEH1_9BACT|nr:hypothetical protein [Fibrella rubiginis]